MARDATARERDPNALLERRSSLRLAGLAAALVAVAGATGSADAAPSDTIAVPAGETETVEVSGGFPGLLLGTSNSPVFSSLAREFLGLPDLPRSPQLPDLHRRSQLDSLASPLHALPTPSTFSPNASLVHPLTGSLPGTSPVRSSDASPTHHLSTPQRILG